MWRSNNIPNNSLTYKKYLKMFQRFALPQKKSIEPVQGFTLIELMIAVAVVSILAAIATPYFAEYIKRGKLSKGMTELSQLALQMEKSYLDLHNYGEQGICRVSAQSDEYFNYKCTTNGQSYTWVATTNDEKYAYSINQNGQRVTLKFSGSSTTTPDCWMISEGGCY